MRQHSSEPILAVNTMEFCVWRVTGLCRIETKNLPMSALPTTRSQTRSRHLLCYPSCHSRCNSGVKARVMRRGIVVINSRWRIGIAGVIILALSATIVLWHSYKITTQSQDPDGDVNAIRAKAEQGDVQAEFRLASMYGSGNGAPRDYSLALRWYRAAAEKK